MSPTWSSSMVLASADGTPNKTKKATLANHLKNSIPAADIIPPSCATVIDGMSMDQKMKCDQMLFADVADNLLSRALAEGSNSQRIVVFDVYREESIKNVEREKRVSEDGHEFRNIKPEHKIHKWHKFLAHSNNKSLFIKFIAEEWQKEKYKQKIAEKTIFVTVEDRCYELSRHEAKENQDLRSTHEEADTRMLLHAAHAADKGYSAVVISSDDTDVLVLCIAFQSSIPCEIFVKSGTQNRTKYVKVADVDHFFGSELCECLPGLHAFTGCDSVSAFSGKGKIAPLRIVKKHKKFQSLFLHVGAEWQLSDDDLILLE